MNSYYKLDREPHANQLGVDSIIFYTIEDPIGEITDRVWGAIFGDEELEGQ